MNESQSCSAENENLKRLLSDAKNQTIKCQQADSCSDNKVNDLQEQIEKLLELNRKLTNESADLQIQNQDLLKLNEKITNESFSHQNKAKKLRKLNKKFVTDINFLHEKVNNLGIENEKLINSCNETDGNSDFDTLQPIGNVFVSSITAVENAREVDICLGMSTVIGYFTSRSCCDVNKIYVFDIESSSEIIFDENSVSVEEHICFINTTEVDQINFKDTNFDDPQNCSIVVYDESQERLKNYFHTFEIQRCFDSPCLFQIDLTTIQNTTILNGTSVFCHESGHFGIIINSESFLKASSQNDYDIFVKVPTRQSFLK